MSSPKQKELTELLEKIHSLTHQWVIAEHTMDCSHTYGKIREVVREALDVLKSGEDI